MGLFASTDWVMGLEPHYKSTVFGLVLIAGQTVSALCVLIGALALLSRTVLDDALASPDDWNDLSTVLLTATMMYCYLVVCQFVINWMGNTQDDVHWYLQRTANGWYAVSWLLVTFHLLLPLLLLTWRRVKRSPAALLIVCGVLLVTRAVDGFWTVNASGEDPTPLLLSRLSWLDLVLPVAIGCGWLAAFIWLLGRRPLGAESPYAAAGGGPCRLNAATDSDGGASRRGSGSRRRPGRRWPATCSASGRSCRSWPCSDCDGGRPSRRPSRRRRRPIGRRPRRR